MNNNPPFAIGQKVVCVKAESFFPYLSSAPLVNGAQYTILGIERVCCGWHVDIGLYSGKEMVKCHRCEGNMLKPSLNFWLSSERFVPIITNYSDATAEIMEKFKQTNEVPDKIIVPEPANQ